MSEDDHPTDTVEPISHNVYVRGKNLWGYFWYIRNVGVHVKEKKAWYSIQ